MTAFLNNANDNQDVQNQQIEEMISQGAKALVINLADVNQGGAIIGKYCNQVALVFFNRNPGDKALAKCQNAYFVDGDATQAGVLQGLKVLELWKENPDWDKNKDGKIQFAMLEGLVGHAGAQARTKWAISTMESYPELGIPVESVFHEHAMFNKEIAKETVSRWALSPAFGRVEIILANNDAMALGASGALSERQINLPIFGIDATSEALDAIKADRMTATVLNDATNQAKVALRLASNLAADVSPLNGIDYRMEYRVIQVPYQEVQ
ncbi:galactose ABC transporter substrate-binding protein [Moraxella lacunata]|uniref:galactose ABC transporter substrate-binding protein n=1 Tax=Moraxella lacunata TaxID=477 RepID=UPI000A9F5C0A